MHHCFALFMGIALRYERKKAEARFRHVYTVVSGDECHYCGLPSDGHDHRPAIHSLHKFASSRLVTRKEIEGRFGKCRLVPCCTICNMGIGSFDGANDDECREEILGFIDFFDDDGPTRGSWNYGAFCTAVEILTARTIGNVGDEIYAIPVVGRAVISHALRSKMGQWQDDAFWSAHRERLATWLKSAPRRKSKHFLTMARLESYKFRDGVYGR